MPEYRNKKTGTVYAQVDMTTSHTGYVAVLTKAGARYLVKESSLEATGDDLGKLPNQRAGFYHIHSASYECGIAYWSYDDSYDHPFEGRYLPCKKLVNHEGLCGFEDNTAF